MNRLTTLLVILLLTGCGEQVRVPNVTSTVEFDSMQNADLRMTTQSLGEIDKTVSINGIPDSPFVINVGIAGSFASTSGSSTADIIFEVVDGQLQPLNNDWEFAGGNERPALRRESNTEIVIYYPTEYGAKRTWVKFHVKVLLSN